MTVDKADHEKRQKARKDRERGIIARAVKAAEDRILSLLEDDDGGGDDGGDKADDQKTDNDNGDGGES